MPVYHRVAESELYRFSREVFIAAGVPDENAAVVADNLTQGELHGLGSHGVSRLLGVYARRFVQGGINPRPDVRVLRQSRGTAVVDGDNGPGAVAGQYAMRLAIDLAREHGVGWVAVTRSNHFGAAFLFAREAMQQDMIGFATTSAVALIAPWGGRTPALGTNPLCFAIPGGQRGDVILDMATTVVARGKIQVAQIENKPIPLGWAVDRNEQPTTDPTEALKGRMLPLGGYKGYGLALVVEILSSLLSGAAMSTEIGELFTGLDAPQGMGHCFGAIDISGFCPPAEFRARMDGLIGYVKGVELAPGFDEVLLPGEPEARKAAENRRDGIPLSEDVLAILQKLGDELHVSALRLIGA